jgi:hypothetical protein
VIYHRSMRKLRSGLNFRDNFGFFLRFNQLSFLRVNLFFLLMCFVVIRGLIFRLKWLRIIIFIKCWWVFWRFIFPSRLRILTFSRRRFFKPRFFVQFFKKPIFSFKNTLCKLPSKVVDFLFSKRICKAFAIFAPLVPDSYVVINCNCICIFCLFVDVVQMDKTELRCPFVVTGFFLKIYAWFWVLTK